jgi:hypothetical protein
MSLSENQKYVLYIVPSDQHCIELLEKLKQEYNHVLQKCHVQDVRALPSRPPWLQFVPTLVERSSKQMYAGTDIIEFVKGMPPEFTFDSLKSGKTGKMSLISSGSSMNSSKLNSFQSGAFTLESEQKTASPPTTGPPGSRLAEQQRREAETHQRLSDINASRQATMPRHQPGGGAMMTQDRMFQVESMGPRQDPIAPPSHLYRAPPQQGYGPPQQGYGPPQQGYGPPQQGYGPPQQGYGPPQQGYGPPQQGYGPPQQGYGPPQQGYGPPQQGYGPPQQGYGPPQQSYRPSQTYRHPQQQTPYPGPSGFPSMY